MKLIDSDKFKAKLLSLMDRETTMPSETDCILDGVINLLEEQPTIGPVKHGLWIDKPSRCRFATMKYECSVCGKVRWEKHNFCP